LTQFEKEKAFLIKNSQTEKRHHLKVRRITIIRDATEVSVCHQKYFSTGCDLRHREMVKLEENPDST